MCQCKEPSHNSNVLYQFTYNSGTVYFPTGMWNGVVKYASQADMTQRSEEPTSYSIREAGLDQLGLRGQGRVGCLGQQGGGCANNPGFGGVQRPFVLASTSHLGRRKQGGSQHPVSSLMTFCPRSLRLPPGLFHARSCPTCR